jgi:hypothetical protein
MRFHFVRARITVHDYPDDAQIPLSGAPLENIGASLPGSRQMNLANTKALLPDSQGIPLTRFMLFPLTFHCFNDHYRGSKRLREFQIASHLLDFRKKELQHSSRAHLG